MYSRHSVGPRGIRYRCHDRKCRAFVTLCPTTKKCMRFIDAPVHKHTKSDASVNTLYWNLVALNEMRKQCSNLTTLADGKRLASVRSIFANVKQQ